MRCRVIFRALLLLLLGASVAWAAPGDAAKWGQVEGWDIRVDRTVGDGCFAMQVYEDDSILRVGFNQTSKTIYFVIGNTSWKSIEVGKRYNMRFVFDDQIPYDGELVGTKLGNTIFLEHSNVSVKFTEDFMQRNALRVYYQGNRIASLSLKNTYAALGEVLNCQSAMNGNGNGAGGSQPASDPFSGGRSRDPFR